MNIQQARRFATPAVLAASSLCLVAWLALNAPPLNAMNAPLAPSSDEPQDATETEPGTASSAPFLPRRLRSSLSMPYFSFAQPLTPRS
ncbi:hypothetical protein [Stenotrophomonas sp. 24(2023)]|uniref:hypothetical protein n=1 Tax=Stenotrophomonas sp. 24(2023) TaxID=3068324 RepID=UPI0027E1F74D|nr:hypothetical protein [Stenotrophomonas sp. 24(2023)]WMJ69738.1 hypothetical protein Q9R17_01100 [Stenotrophomonas sp. 24(2023)]